MAFETHNDASQFFLGRSCKDERNMDHKGNPLCNEELAAIMETAQRAGYESIQFTGHCETRCRSCAHELVLLGFNGGATCPSNLTYFSAPAKPCKCIEYGQSERGSCAACSTTAEALDEDYRARTWPPRQNSSQPAWQSACAQEAEREANIMRVSVNHTCEHMDDCLARLKRTIYARETLRNRVRLVPIDESKFDICTEFDNHSRFCELGYGEGGPIAKKACIAPSACYRFDLHKILAWSDSMASIAKSRNVCNVAMRGHTLACNEIPRLDGHTIVYAHEGYEWWDSLRIKYYMWRFKNIYSMIGTSHSGGLLLTYGMMVCKHVNVYGMGTYSNNSDLIYQHYYDKTTRDTCVDECWHGGSRLPNSTKKDSDFFRDKSDQVCRPHTTCDTPQSGVPATPPWQCCATRSARRRCER